MKKKYKYTICLSKLNKRFEYHIGLKYIKRFTDRRIPRKAKKALKREDLYEFTGLRYVHGHVFWFDYTNHMVKYPKKQRSCPLFNRYLNKMRKKKLNSRDRSAYFCFNETNKA